ncbi:MAG: zinc dependent phospholipase C family protein [Bacilli bacterium]|jgi:hypothetical protein|nr:zinc dependent phospholipase C family protein [Bacilli bacterium]
MPSLLTHAFFADDFLEQHQSENNFLTSYPDAFRLGSEGPDPLFFYGLNLKRGLRLKASKEKIGSQLHHTDGTKFFSLLFEQENKLLLPDQIGVFTAFILGQFAHYLLDSTCHPYVYYWSGFDSSGHLSGKYHYAHAHFEAEIDTALAFKKAKTEMIKKPWEVLDIEEEDLSCISENFTSVLEQFVSHPLRKHYYQDAVRDMKEIYIFVNTSSSFRKKLLGKSSLGQIYIPREPSSLVLNDSHLVWEEPSSGLKRNEGFNELYQRALNKLEGAYEAMVRAEPSYEALKMYFKGLNYNGLSEGQINIHSDPDKRMIAK